MTSQAHVEFDAAGFGVRIAIQRKSDNGPIREILQWEPLVSRTYDASAGSAQPNDADWLRLPENDARALYEALADHFGHSGNDTRALRRDYDAERKRVDLLIDKLVKP
jgi:hypothetical protein